MVSIDLHIINNKFNMNVSVLQMLLTWAFSLRWESRMVPRSRAVGTGGKMTPLMNMPGIGSYCLK